MNLNFIPLISALLPAVGVHVCYVVAAQLGHVPWCIPYIDSCTSISAVGRNSPESHIFHATIIPTAVFMMIYWRLNYEWLKALDGRTRIWNRGMLFCGLIASLGIIVYATVLGAVGEAYYLQRRIGVTTFYVFTLTAQLLMTIQVRGAAGHRPAQVSVGLVRGLIAICALIALLGLVNVGSGILYRGYGDIDDAIAWSITLCILAYFFVTYFAWKHSGFRARFSVAAS